MFSLLLICMGIGFGKAQLGNSQNISLRLINSFGNNKREGRLEIYYNGSWGTVCDDSFTDASARVACASLGFGDKSTVIDKRHGAGTGKVWLDDVRCTGTESGIERCLHNEWGVHNCDHSEDVSISCGPSVRLNNSVGYRSEEGRLEIYYSGRWGTVCGDHFTNISARVACASLGFSHTGAVIVNRHGEGTGPIWLFDVNCNASESGIEQCIHEGSDASNCSHQEDVSIHCGNTQDFAVRLNFGYASKEGRLEIYYSGIWGTVCASGFTHVSARVACASLGYGYEGTVIRNRFDSYDYGAGSGPIWLDGVDCTGTESGIEHCAHNGWGANNCSHREHVVISCACGIRDFSGPTGHISSPNFPGQYAGGLDCYNYITISSGEGIIITFLEFDTEELDFVTISCESGNASRSTSHSGSELPPVLTVSSCNRISVNFRSDYYSTNTTTGFSLIYNVTTDNVIGGITTIPLNAFFRSDKNNLIIFNCTTASEYLPWWTFSPRHSGVSFTLTNSTCGLRTSASDDSNPVQLMTETLGPGSCNLIMCVPANYSNLLAGSVVCTDSTLSAAIAILAPINLEVRFIKEMNSSAIVSDVVRDEEIIISCTASFSDFHSTSSLEFIDILYRGGPVVRVRILDIYFTSEEELYTIIEPSKKSSYTLVKAPEDGIFPPYTFKIVCSFSTNIYDLSGDSSMELSFSTDPVNITILYWPTEDTMRIIGHDNGQIRTPALLNCSADANPPASYTWIDESNGYTINAPTIIVTHGGNYTCTASNIIRGRRYQQSKSITLQAVEDKTTPNQVVLIALGVSVLTIIIILVIIVIRLCRQQESTNDNSKEYELPQRGGESNLYDGVGESEYDKPDDIRRCLPAIPSIYDEIVDLDCGHQHEQPGGCNHYESVKENEIDVKESDYECPDASQRPISTIYYELEFDK